MGMINYCNRCGGKVGLAKPPGDSRERAVCGSCGYVQYENPRLVVGCIPIWEEKILLVRRAIEPRLGRWTLPAGFLENGETLSDGARRETTEEAGADTGGLVPFGMYNLTQVNQVYVMFRTDLLHTDFRGGAESLEVRLFTEAEIPWDEMAFKVMRICLEQFLSDRSQGTFSFHSEDIYFER